MGNGHKTGIAWCLIAMSLGASQPAIAQEESTSGTNDAGTDDRATDEHEILVTAQFREQRLQDTPIAITAMNAEMMEQRGIDDVRGVAQTAPNVTLSAPNGSYGKSVVAYIRGIGQFDFNPALEPGVGIYIDDVYYPTVFGTAFDLVDPERVEILRGPQGTLAGKNSVGGAIKLYSKKPSGEGGGHVKATLGSFERREFDASIDFAMAPDLLFARISGIARREDGYVKLMDYGCVNPGSGLPSNANDDSCQVGTLGGRNVIGGRAYFRLIPSSSFELDLIADYIDDRSEGNAVVIDQGVGSAAPYVPTADDRYVNYSTFFSDRFDYSAPPLNASTNWGISGQAHWDLSDSLNLLAIVSYRGTTGHFTYDNDNSPRDLTLFDQTFDSESLTGEIRLNGTMGSIFDWTLGAFLYDGDVLNGGRVIAVVPGFNFIQNDTVKNDSKSLFAHGILSITEKLDLIAGVRYTEESKTYTFHRRQADGSINPAVTRIDGFSGGYEGDEIDYRLAANYQFAPDVMIYAQVATGFKGGGIGPRPFYPEQIQPFRPEFLTSYEVGMKSYLFDRALRFNVTGFISKYKDIQITLRSCPQFTPPNAAQICSLPQNAGDATIKGLEAEAQLNLVDGLLIDASGSYLHFNYTFINPAAGIPNARTTPFTPEWQGSLGIQYTARLSGGSSFIPRVDITHRSSIFSDASNNSTNFLPALTLMNARLSWRSADENWEISGAVTNVFDKFYYFTRDDGSLGNLGVVNGTVAEPRRWSVSLKRFF